MCTGWYACVRVYVDVLFFFDWVGVVWFYLILFFSSLFKIIFFLSFFFFYPFFPLFPSYFFFSFRRFSFLLFSFLSSLFGAHSQTSILLLPSQYILARILLLYRFTRTTVLVLNLETRFNMFILLYDVPASLHFKCRFMNTYIIYFQFSIF